MRDKDKYYYRAYSKEHNSVLPVTCLNYTSPFSKLAKIEVAIETGNYGGDVSYDIEVLPWDNAYVSLMRCSGIQHYSTSVWDNDKLIFDGDILKDKHEKLYQVKDKGYAFEIEQGFLLSPIMVNLKQLKIIGNIYGNSNLLNKTKMNEKDKEGRLKRLYT